jgi:Zn-dependent peptidase ImmA (M78 family)
MTKSIAHVDDVEVQAEALLGGHKSAIPVNLIAVAKRLGLVIEPAVLGDDVSGILVVDGDRGVIGYNRDQSDARQRFTIAHEIGHYVLHRQSQALFIDKNYQAAFFRSHASASKSDPREREANSFAAALLMPRIPIEREFKKCTLLELGNDDGPIAIMARMFGVSTQAMTYRLTNLNLLSGE